MNYLLDTQAIIWTLENNPQLPQSIKDTVEDPDNNIFITIVSLWEIVIKRSINKLALQHELQDIQQTLTSEQTSILPITIAHLETLESLAFVEKHRDPFDRLIISQAITENMTIITSDSQFGKYPVKTLW